MAVDVEAGHLRIWALSADGAVLDRVSAVSGVADVRAETVEALILEHAGTWIDGPIRVLVSGLLSPSGDAAPVPLPCAPPDGSHARPLAMKDPRLRAYALPPVVQSRPADVLQGTYVQVAGFLKAQSQFDGVLCLPGAYSRWVQVSAAEIVSVRSFMTGALFDLLSDDLGLGAYLEEALTDPDRASFEAGVQDGLARSHLLTSDILELRATALLARQTSEAARARLFGLLVGVELAGARPYWLGQNLAVIATAPLTQLYQSALHMQAVTASCVDGEEMMLAGLRAACATLDPDDQVSNGR
ncbi:MAG: 2-dehydro-3-deoxygalactonokinase [Pseudomonadota bacterium]